MDVSSFSSKRLGSSVGVYSVIVNVYLRNVTLSCVTQSRVLFPWFINWFIAGAFKGSMPLFRNFGMHSGFQPESTQRRLAAVMNAYYP